MRERSGPAPTEQPTRWVLVLGLFSIAIVGFSISQSGPVAAIPEIARSVGSSLDATAWVLTASLLTAGLGTSMMGRLSDLYGVRIVVSVTLVLLVLGSVVCVATSNLEILVAGRALQGFGSGLFPTCYSVIAVHVPARARKVSTGLVGALIGAAGGAGPAVGGLLVDDASYRWLFATTGVSGAIALLGLPFLLPRRATTSTARLDLAGALGLTVGITAVLAGISRGSAAGWTNPLVLGAIAAGLLALTWFTRYERGATSPLVDVITLRIRMVALTNVAAFFVGFSMYACCILVPEIARAPLTTSYGLGASATESGLLLVPGCVLMVLASTSAARIQRSMGGRGSLVLACAVSTAGAVALTAWHSSTVAVVLTVSVTFLGFGLGFAVMPDLIMGAVAREQVGESTGLNALTRIVGSSVGSQAVIGVLIGATGSARAVPTGAAFGWAFAVATVASGLALLAACLLRGRPDPVAASGPLIGAGSGASH